MMFAGDLSPLPRRRLLDTLSSSHPVVALTGPKGAGASTTLRQWAADREDVTWAVGMVPDVVDSRFAAHGAALIIDDADDLSPDDWARLTRLVAARPQLLVRLAVHSRAVIPASHTVEFAESMLFTVAETAEYLARAGAVLEAAAVHRVTGGLAAAVRALARHTVLSPPLVDAALAALAPEPLPREFAALAAPDVLTNEVAEALGASSEFLDRCERSGMGEWVPGFGHPLFVLSGPVRAATRVAHPSLSEQVQMHTRRRAAEVLLAQGAWYGALREGAATHALDIVDAALKGGGLPLLRMHGASLPEYLRSIRARELRRWPVVAMALALVFNARREHRVRAAEMMGIALIGAPVAPAGSGERALLKVIESVLRRLLAVGDGGVKAAQSAARMLSEISDDERQSIAGVLSDLHAHAGISLMNGGRDAEAAAEFENALAVTSRPAARLIALGGLALVHADAGDMISARSWIDKALRQPWHDGMLQEYQGSMLLIAHARAQIEGGDLDGAEESLDGVWHIIDTIEHWPLLVHVRSIIDICRGDSQLGLERLHAVRRQRGSRIPRRQARLLDLTESSLHLAAGDMAAARALTVHTRDAPAVVCGVARVRLFDGEPERALRLLSGIAAEQPAERAVVAALEAVALRDLGRDPAGPAARARSVAHAFGLSTPFLLLPPGGREVFGDQMRWQVGDSVAMPIASRPRLTPRELVLLGRLAETPNLLDIAAELHVSINTLKTQRRSLYRKLGATSRDEALAIAAGYGMLSIRRPAASSQERSTR
ncbi:LuxR C-terminal-related transcriptional regulator [Microbacterium sp. NPDC089987]|uniref:helix-turn-helix transcriptional regulator n=1 Tax=Microbacterium sp. NPDC089987 TaxID=3364202 RepID=UPI003804918E